MWVWILLTGLVLALITLNLLYLRFQFTYDILYTGREKRLFISVVPVFKRFGWEKKVYAPASPSEWIDLVAGLIDKKKPGNKHQTSTSQKNRKEETMVKPSQPMPKLRFFDYYRLFRMLMSRMVLERLKWRTSLGLDDPMNTALVCGGIWAFKGNFMGLISHFTSLEHVELGVEPVYNQTGFSSQLDSIFKIRIVYIMLIIIYASFISVRGYINGFAAGKAQPSH